ncbi:MAG: hypothetical protein AAFW76_05215 [Pseudomonadota bacterium]
MLRASESTDDLAAIEDQSERASRDVGSDFDRRVLVLNRDPFLSVADEALRLISVFDDLKYDRADLDMLSGPMRRHALKKLTPFGFTQVSGTVFENKADDIRMYLPKFHALGASPFDTTRYTPRRAQDYYVLTPTQAACQIVDHYPIDDAVQKIKRLIVKHPVNLLRMVDFLERKDSHQAFLGAIGHLKLVQREAVEAEPLRTRRALR